MSVIDVIRQTTANHSSACGVIVVRFEECASFYASHVFFFFVFCLFVSERCGSSWIPSHTLATFGLGGALHLCVGAERVWPRVAYPPLLSG